MVRALLEGRKTQTRRILKPQPQPCDHKLPVNDGTGREFTPAGWEGEGPFVLSRGETYCSTCGAGVRPDGRAIRLRMAVGDRLWVRESLCAASNDQGVRWLSYAADGKDVWPTTPWTKERDSVPSIHMPRWASRLTLNVTDVRVQRLQDISEEDAAAEGMDDATAQIVLSPEERHMLAYAHISTPHALSRIIFETVWEQINGPDSWQANPWVAAYTFTVERQNIDASASGDPSHAGHA